MNWATAIQLERRARHGVAVGRRVLIAPLYLTGIAVSCDESPFGRLEA